MNNKITIYLLNTDEIEKNLNKVTSKLTSAQILRAREFKIKQDMLEHMGSAYLIDRFMNGGEIKYNKFGKPYKDGQYFNVTHSAGLVVMAKYIHDVGIDVEKERHFTSNTVKRLFSNEEQDIAKTDAQITRLWTERESLLKCIGTGINEQILKIPSQPEGVFTFGDECYYTKTIECSPYFISVTAKAKSEAQIKIINVKI